MSDTQIKLVRLSTGEELIGEYKAGGDSYIKNPAILIPTEDRQLTLSPFMPYTKIGEGEHLHIRNEYIMFVTTPSERLTEYYRQMYSNVITPEKQSIIT